MSSAEAVKLGDTSTSPIITLRIVKSPITLGTNYLDAVNTTAVWRPLEVSLSDRQAE